jgi:predicted transcriptional regulator of viral defense system
MNKNIHFTTNPISDLLHSDQHIVRAKDLEGLGYSRTAIVRMVERGQLEWRSRGIYAVVGNPSSAHHALAEVVLRVPSAAICLLSALEYHNLTTQLPFEVWIALPNQTRKPELVGVRAQFFDAKHFEEGLENHPIDGVSVRIYNAARTVADCFKFRHKIGLDVALEALQQGLREKRFTPDELWHMAGINRVQRIITPYLEMAVLA